MKMSVEMLPMTLSLAGNDESEDYDGILMIMQVIVMMVLLRMMIMMVIEMMAMGIMIMIMLMNIISFMSMNDDENDTCKAITHTTQPPSTRAALRGALAANDQSATLTIG